MEPWVSSGVGGGGGLEVEEKGHLHALPDDVGVGEGRADAHEPHLGVLVYDGVGINRCSSVRWFRDN